MSQEVLSLDISAHYPVDIDIREFFPLTSLMVSNESGATQVENFLDFFPDLDFSLDTTVRVDGFYTLETLDLALRELVDEGYGRWGRVSKPARPQTLDLVPPLEHIPYGALDIRREQPIRAKRRYSDLFRRSLPRSLMMRRNYQETKRYIRAKKRPILVALLSLVSVLIPLLLYVKYSIDHGYAALVSLKEATSLREVQEKIRTARGDFERAGFFFLPFSWLP